MSLLDTITQLQTTIANLTTRIVSLENFKSQIKVTYLTNTDIDTIITSGFYGVDKNCTGNPDTLYFKMLVIGDSDVAQILIPLANSPKGIYYRLRINGSWTRYFHITST